MQFLIRALLAAALTLAPSVVLAPPAAAATTGPHISIAGVSLKEDDRQALFKVTVTGVHGDVTVNYATRDGSAIPGKDYSATSGPVTIKAADSEALVVVKVVADTILEPAENFYVDLSNTITATIDVGSAEGIIKNDDPLPTVSVGNAQVTEAEDVNKAVMAVFPVYLSNAASQPVSVDFATADYCATGWPLGRASGLCSEQRGTVQFAAEDNTTQVIKVPVWGDRSTSWTSSSNSTSATRCMRGSAARKRSAPSTTTTPCQRSTPTMWWWRRATAASLRHMSHSP